jgi:hypothetical protein
MKKKINTQAIVNELQGSVFFPKRQQEPVEQEDIPTPSHQTATQPEPQINKPSPATALPAREQASIDASKHASTLAVNTDIEVIRKIVKSIGKEVLYVRLTPEEKNQVTDIEYTYERQGIKTSGNEIGRIALNFLLAEYKANGEQSILAQVLVALHT